MNGSIFYLSPFFIVQGDELSTEGPLVCKNMENVLPARQIIIYILIHICVGSYCSVSHIFLSLLSVSFTLIACYFLIFLRWHALDWSAGNRANLSVSVFYSVFPLRAVCILNPPVSACRVGVQMTAVFGCYCCCAPH